MNTIFCTVVLSVIPGIALNTGVLSFSKGRTLQVVYFIIDLTMSNKVRLHLPDTPYSYGVSQDASLWNNFRNS
jgi:hypothetical protein